MTMRIVIMKRVVLVSPNRKHTVREHREIYLYLFFQKGNDKKLKPEYVSKTLKTTFKFVQHDPLIVYQLAFTMRWFVTIHRSMSYFHLISCKFLDCQKKEMAFHEWKVSISRQRGVGHTTWMIILLFHVAFSIWIILSYFILFYSNLLIIVE